MHQYERKEKIVLMNNSKVFDEWQKRGHITKEEFLEALKWVCEDPLDEYGHMTREVGLIPTANAMNKYFVDNGLEKWAPQKLHDNNELKGKIIKLERINDYKDGYQFVGFYDIEKKRTWTCSNYSLRLNCLDSI